MIEEESGFVKQFKSLFKGFNEDDNERGLPLQTGANASGTTMFRDASDDGKLNGGSTNVVSAEVMSGFQTLSSYDRFTQYSMLQQMADEPIFDSALDMHLAHALSVDSQTGLIITIEANDPAFTDLAAQINADLGGILNRDITRWTKIAAIFGDFYLRPYGEAGKGITHIQADYFTLPTHIREYVRCGELAGFTSEHLLKDESSSIELAMPWTLVPLKMPTWKPNINKEPENLTGYNYSLYDDVYHRSPQETQNYGTSLLFGAYEPWIHMREGLASLRGSRHNASTIQRLVTVGMEGLSPMAAAQHLNDVGATLKGSAQKAMKEANKKSLLPTVITSLLPSLSGGKNGINIDTHSVVPDIQHIEDIMFHLKRACSSLGIDVSLLGWGDLMSGGLGEGGFFRSSIQAAIRANYLRIAVREAVHRLIDIHLVYKYRKTYTGKRPFEVKFHSLNTAVAQEEADTALSNIEQVTAVVTALDMLEQGSMAKSETFKNEVYTNILKMDEEKAVNILKELKANAGGDENMMESIERLEGLAEQAARKELNKYILED